MVYYRTSREGIAGMGKDRIRNSRAITAESLMERMRGGDAEELETRVAELETEKADLLAIVERAEFVRDENGAFIDPYTGIRLDRRGLHLEKELTPEVFDHFAQRLVAFYNQMQLWIGDMVNLARHQFKFLDIEQLAQQYNLDPKTIDEYAKICRTVPMEDRFDNLSYSHYRLVRSAKYDDNRKALLYEASIGNMTVDQFGDFLDSLIPAKDTDEQDRLSKLGGNKFRVFERDIMGLFDRVAHTEKLMWIQRAEMLVKSMRDKLNE